MVQQHGLGRGLSSLIPPKKTDTDSPFKDIVIKTMTAQGVDLGASTPRAASPSTAAEPTPNSIAEIPIASIVPNPHQPRLRFDETKLRELAESIREHGILQPVSVTSISEGKYELIAGERRLQAAKLAGLPTVPAIVRDADDRQKLELAIIENVQRHDLNPIEEGKAYVRLMEEFGLTQDETAKKLGKSRSVVANGVRLLALPVEIQRAVAEERLSEGHAKALLTVDNPEKQRALFEEILKSDMTVRETETRARSVSVRPHTRRLSGVTPEIAERMETLSRALGTKVHIKPSGDGGKIVVEYYSPEEFETIVGRLVDTGEAAA